MSLPTVSSKLPPDAPVPRLCHLVKWADFDGYGFNLHAEKSRTGQFIGKVDDQSPAQTAGLREGDRIIEVNGVNIANENHRQVVERIKSIPNETKLLVVDEEADGWYKERKIVVKSTQENVSSMKTPVPRPSQDPPLYVNVAPTLAENGVEKSANGVVHDPEEHIQKHEVKLNGSATAHSNGGPIEEKTIEREIEIEQEIEREIVREPSPKIIRGKPLDSPNHKTKDEGSSSRSSTPMDGGSTGSVPDSPHSIKSNTSSTFNGVSSTQIDSSMGGLNLNMSASEMRQMLAARRKKDPKKDQMDIRQKYEIIQQM